MDSNTYKLHLMDLVANSDHIKAELTTNQRLEMLTWVKQMKPYEVKNLLSEYGIRSLEPKIKRALKYGLAAIAGGILLKTAIAVPVSAIVYYVYRKYTDPCYIKCKQMPNKRLCELDCRVKSIQRIISEIQSQYNLCSNTKNQERCERELKKLDDKWKKKLTVASQQLHDEKTKISQKSVETRG